MRGTSILTVPVDALSTAVRGLLLRLVAAPTGWVVTAVRASAFWTAVVLPLVYLPLLAGESGAVDLPVLAGFLALHAVALLVGHVYDGVVGQFDRVERSW